MPSRNMEQPCLRLHSGAHMPQVGLGTWKSTSEEVGNAVKTAVRAGYRHIDTAEAYLNEKVIGDALQDLFKEGVVKREDLFITTKLWNTHHQPEHVRQACEKQLKDLKLDYVDLYLMHYPIALQFGGVELTENTIIPFDEKTNLPKLDKVPLHETWAAMERLVEDGLAKNIGISNFTIPVIADLLTYCKIKPAVNQIELHPYFTRESIKDFCEKNGIHITAYSPLGSGKEGPLQDESVQAIAKKHQRDPGQILIRWSMQNGNIVIPKSTSDKRIKSNFEVFDFTLSDAEMKTLTNLNKNFVTCKTTEYWKGFDLFAL